MTTSVKIDNLEQWIEEKNNLYVGGDSKWYNPFKVKDNTGKSLLSYVNYI